MVNVEVTDNADKKAKGYQITKPFHKQIAFLRTNPRHNSLKFQPLEASKGVYKFRVTKHYWGLVIKVGINDLKVYDVIKHLK